MTKININRTFGYILKEKQKSKTLNKSHGKQTTPNIVIAQYIPVESNISHLTTCS